MPHTELIFYKENDADILRDGIYELRAKLGHVQYRILYFFTVAMWPFWLTP